MIYKEEPNVIKIEDGDRALIPAGGKNKFKEVKLPTFPSGLPVTGPDFRTVVGAAYQLHLTNDLSADAIKRITRVPPKIVDVIFNSEAFKTAIELRGVELDSAYLTPEQDLTIQLLSDPTLKGGLTSRLRAAGVPFAKYRAWLKNPVFKDRINRLQSGVLKELEGDMLVALGEKATSGDLRAIEFAFEVTGKHNPAKQEAINLQEAIVQIIDILQQEIKDPELLARIGFRLSGIGAGINKQANKRAITDGD